MLFLRLVFPLLCLHYSQRPRRMSVSPTAGQLWIHPSSHTLHEGVHTQALRNQGHYLQWLCVCFLLWTLLMVPDQKRDEGQIPSYHSVQQQANIKEHRQHHHHHALSSSLLVIVSSITLAFVRITIVLVIKKDLLVLWVKSGVLISSSFHTHWSEVSFRWAIVECPPNIVGVQLWSRECYRVKSTALFSYKHWML